MVRGFRACYAGNTHATQFTVTVKTCAALIPRTSSLRFAASILVECHSIQM